MIEDSGRDIIAAPLPPPLQPIPPWPDPHIVVLLKGPG